MGRKPKSLNVRTEKKEKLTTKPPLSESENPSDKPLTVDQGKQITNTEIFWIWTLKRIEWLQMKDIGFRPPDPLNHPDVCNFKLLHRQLDVTSRYHFTQLQICIHGWELIEHAAKANQREFPFNIPRELFVSVCSEQRESDVSSIVSGSEGGLEKQRQNLRLRNQFYRDKLSAEESQKLLKIYQKSPQWENFIIYAIWDIRDSNPTTRKMWQDFLEAHKNFTSFWCNKDDIDGCRLMIPAWRAGRAIDPKTSKRIMSASLSDR